MYNDKEIVLIFPFLEERDANRYVLAKRIAMKIKKLQADNFMLFNNIDIEFSPHINIISGENSTGKTALIKLLYASLKGYANVNDSKQNITKDFVESAIVSKLQGVFRPDHDSVGRLVNRVQGSNRADISILMDNGFDMRYGFSNRHSTHIELKNSSYADMGKITTAYIPPKEIISATENFGSLYSQYHIAFEETYYDLAQLLERPLRKGPNTKEQNTVMKSFEKIVNGSINQRDKKFYLKVSGSGEFEMGLVSEGYRKLATVMYLILSGSLTKDSILFWDEPETNMNPKMIQPMTEALIELAKMGVQIFITTHDYFVQQAFNLDAYYKNEARKQNKLDYKFISLNRDIQGGIECESVSDLSDLTHNAIMEEFDALYDREQRLIYGN